MRAAPSQQRLLPDEGPQRPAGLPEQGEGLAAAQTGRPRRSPAPTETSAQGLPRPRAAGEVGAGRPAVRRPGPVATSGTQQPAECHVQSSQPGERPGRGAPERGDRAPLFGQRTGFWQPPLVCGWGGCQAGVSSCWPARGWGGGRQGQREVSGGAAAPQLAPLRPSTILLGETVPAWPGAPLGLDTAACTALGPLFSTTPQIFWLRFRG